MYKKNILKQTAEKIMQKENKNSFGKNFEKNISVTGKDGTKMENFRMLGMGLQEQIDDIVIDNSIFALRTDKLSVFAPSTSTDLAGVISDETGSGLLVFNTAPTFNTNITTPLIIGGALASSKITYKSTTGAGSLGGIAHQWLGGTDGNVVIATMLNNGNIGIGTDAPIDPIHIYIDDDSGLNLTVENINAGTSAFAGITGINDLDNSVNVLCTSSTFSVIPNATDTAIVAGYGTAGGLMLYTNIGDITLNPATWTKTAADIEITDTTKGIILVSPDATRWRITVDNAGALIITSL